MDLITVRHAPLEAMADHGRPPAYVSSSELGRHLGVTSVQASYLARTGVLAREPEPTHPGRYTYELVTSLTCYMNPLNARVEELRRHSAGNEPRERS